MGSRYSRVHSSEDPGVPPISVFDRPTHPAHRPGSQVCIRSLRSCGPKPLRPPEALNEQRGRRQWSLQ
jgi:hypothetical protein